MGLTDGFGAIAIAVAPRRLRQFLVGAKHLHEKYHGRTDKHHANASPVGDVLTRVATAINLSTEATHGGDGALRCALHTLQIWALRFIGEATSRKTRGLKLSYTARANRSI
ncbi:MAG: hypothetical protein WBC69_17955, partial [Geitlerinemataceae cyanobacterium]